MTVNKISREYSRSVQVRTRNGNQQWITAKAGMEASVTVGENIDASFMALQVISEKEVEKTLAAKLKELGAA